MDSLRKVEEDLRGLGQEYRKYPEVSDASERALTTLKTMREMYVADKMRKSGLEKEDVRIPQSSDIVAPYLLACNYADASPKLLLLALNGIQMLVSFEMSPPSDVKNLLRVFAIQAASGRSELQLKVLQVLLHLATQLAGSEELCSYLTQTTLHDFFSLLLDLCGEGALSVSTTALATLRQVLAIVLDPLCAPLDQGGDAALSRINSREVKGGFSKSVLAFCGDLSLFTRGAPGEWCRGVTVPQGAAFDLLDYTLNGWKAVFLEQPDFRAFVKTALFPALKALLQDLQEDYARHVLASGVAAASARTSRAVRLARTFLLNFSVCEDFLGEVDIVTNLLVHTLSSDYDVEHSTSRGSHGSSSGDEKDPQVDAPSSMMGGASALIGGLARFNLPFGANKEKDKPPTGSAALQAAYLPLSGCTSGGSYLSSPQSSSSKPSSRLLAHPAGACVEVLLSFFILDATRVLALQGGREVVQRALVNTVQCACTVLSQALGVQDNVAALVAAAEKSRAITTLEGYLSGTGDADPESMVRSLHEGLLNGATISGADTLILAFYAVQVVSRQLVEFALVAGGPTAAFRAAHIFVDVSAVPSQACLDAGVEAEELGALALCVVGSVHGSVQEVCIALLAAVDYPLLVRRGVGVLSELALVTGLLQLQRPCEAALSAMCRFTVPAWHGEGMLPPPPLQRSGSGSFVSPSKEGSTNPSGGVTLQWKHVQAIVRLSQTVHVLADVLSDWDAVVDAFEQIADCILDPKTAHADDVTATEIDSILSSLARFKQYSVFLSDSALTKLMTSLVAMSLNNLAVTKKSTRTSASSTEDSFDWRAARVTDSKMSHSIKAVPPGAPAYMHDGIAAGLVSFSLQATVEVAKYNTHRSQCVWQMVTSHLKMVAGLTSSITRGVAVQSTFDLIGGMLAFLHAPQSPSSEPVEDVSKASKGARAAQEEGLRVSDDVLFTSVMPSFQTNFLPRRQHADKLQGTQADVTLSQNDILAASKVLAGSRFNDVRTGVMQGLLALLQGGGDVLTQEGWSSVLVLISVAPASLLPASPSSSSTTDDSEDSSAVSEALKWPVAAVAAAFDCMKLVLDEYLESIELGSMTSVITCLSLFSAQLLDVNISLTSLELLWKVYDTTMRGRGSGSEGDRQRQQIFNITTTQLLGLALDTRPEIRHCAMNTLFAALTMSANASLTTGRQWQQIFDDVIFPLFERAGERSSHAIASKEEANAPELKRGTKMRLHHSRDTAHKQWSETRVLALRGLARVVKKCAVQLIEEPWFRTTWATALDVCKKAAEAAAADQEVALAAFDVMFSMLKIVSAENFEGTAATTTSTTGTTDTASATTITTTTSSSSKGSSKDDKQSKTQICRNDMWLSTWAAVNDASKFPSNCPDVALAICQNLLQIYEGGANREFAGMGNLRDVCDCIVTLARPHIPAPGYASGVSSPASPTLARGGVVDMQLYRLLTGFLKALSPRDADSVAVIGSAVVELCFANQYVQMTSPLGERERVFMGPCPEKFRAEVGEFYASSFLQCVTPATAHTHGLVVLDTVFKRFITDICGLAISYRSENAHTEQQMTPLKEVGGSGSGGSGGGGGDGGGGGGRSKGSSVREKLSFFSFLAGAVDGSDTDDREGSEEDAGVNGDANEDFELEPRTPGPGGGGGRSSSSGAEPKTPGPPRSELNFHTLKQCVAPGKSDSTEWTSFYPFSMELQVLTTTLRHCLTEENFSAVDEATRENIFSTFLCFFSPWRASELPGTKESFGPYVSASLSMAAPLMEALEVIHAFASAHPESNWTVALVSALADATRLQIHAVLESSQQEASSEEEIASILSVWRRVSEILSSVAVASSGVVSRRLAIDAILKLARDASYGVLDKKKCPYSKHVLNEGCMIFCRSLLQLESNLDDTPKSFNGRKSQETEMLQSWLLNMTDPPVEEEWKKPSELSETESFSKHGHLFIFLPLAFKLLQCDCEEIKDIVLIITSTVDIAALINSYSDLQSQVMMLQSSSSNKQIM